MTPEEYKKEVNKELKKLKITVPTMMGGSGELDIGGMIRNVAQGATFAFSDELEALGKSAFGGNYEEELNAIRQEMKAYAEANPKAAIAQELLGGTITGSMLLKVPSTLSKTNRFANIIRKGLGEGQSRFLPTRKEVVISGAGGGIYSVGKQEGDINLKETTIDTGISTVAPFVFKPMIAATGSLIQGAGSTASDIVDKVRGKSKPKLSDAEKMLQEQYTFREADPERAFKETKDKLVEASRVEQPVTIMDIGGRGMASTAKYITRLGGPGENILKDFVEKRKKETAPRLINGIKKIFKVETPGNTLDDVYSNLKNISNENYQGIMQTPINLSNKMVNILSSKPYKKGIAEAIRIIEADPKLIQNPELLKTMTDNLKNLQNFVGNIKNQKGTVSLNLEILDLIKRGMNDVINDNTDDFGRLKKTSFIKNLVKLNRDFIDEIDNQATKTIGNSYKEARALYSGQKAREESFNIGRKIMLGGGLSKNINDLSPLIEKMSKEQKIAFTDGVVDALDTLIADGVSPTRALNMMVNKGSFNKVLDKVFSGPEGKAEKAEFINFLTQEARMANTNAQVLSGSDTFANLVKNNQTKSTLKEMARGASFVLLSGSPVSAGIGTADILGSLANLAKKDNVPRELQISLADILKETDPVKIQRQINRLSAKDNKYRQILANALRSIEGGLSFGASTQVPDVIF